jgi:hypothetical protein
LSGAQHGPARPGGKRYLGKPLQIDALESARASSCNRSPPLPAKLGEKAASTCEKKTNDAPARLWQTNRA